MIVSTQSYRNPLWVCSFGNEPNGNRWISEPTYLTGADRKGHFLLTRQRRTKENHIVISEFIYSFSLPSSEGQVFQPLVHILSRAGFLQDPMRDSRQEHILSISLSVSSSFPLWESQVRLGSFLKYFWNDLESFFTIRSLDVRCGTRSVLY